MVGLGKLLWQDTTMEERWRGKTNSAYARGLTWMFPLLCWRAGMWEVVTVLGWKQPSWAQFLCHCAIIRSSMPEPLMLSLGSFFISLMFLPTLPLLSVTRILALTLLSKNQLCLHSWDLTSQLLTVLKCAGTTWRGKHLVWGALQQLKYSYVQQHWFYQINVLYTEMATFLAVQMTCNFH